MSKELSSPDFAKTPTSTANPGTRLRQRARALAAVLMIAGLALVPTLAPLAQRLKDSQSPVKVTGVSARQTGSGTVVTVSADAPLSRTQTWQDGDKFHLILPYAGGDTFKNLPRGVKVNRVSNSLEIVVNMKSGASVTVDPRFNRLNLIVNGGLNQTQNDSDDNFARRGAVAVEQSGAPREYKPSSRPTRERNAAAESFPAIPFFSPRPTLKNSKSLPASSAQEQTKSLSTTARNQEKTAAAASTAPTINTAPPTSTSTSTVAPQDAQPAPAAPVTASDSVVAPPAQPQDAQESSIFSMIFSTTGVAIMLALGLLALAYLRLRPSADDGFEDVVEEKTVTSDSRAKTDERSVALAVNTNREMPVPVAGQRQKERRASKRRKSDKLAVAGGPEQSLDARAQLPAVETAALFGAYRVDQEVGKLMLGQPHRMDVLASRAPDDRRAIETSLLKAMSAPETDEDGRRRARQALEEYGFVARHSAALLLAQDTYERIAAARTLGEIGLPSALPFLLEALYDTETVVRTQAVSSIGSLKIPSAIGALLDMARRYPEMSNALLSQTLSACSLDCLDFGSAFETERPLLDGTVDSNFNGEIVGLEPSAAYEQLPEFLEDETFAEAMERLGNTDVEVRTASARRLAQFQTQQSVAALTALAAHDPEPNVRASAVSSLGEIDHESVFVPVLLAFADEAREVQAAAARSLSRLNFNRADAYVRIIETADAETLGNVARACIKARMAAQAVDRLVNEDRHHAYEAYSLLSLLAKAGETAPLLDAIAEHQDANVQMAAIRLLGMTGHPEVAQQFRQLAVRDGLQEKIRTSLLEVVYKIDQALPV